MTDYPDTPSGNQQNLAAWSIDLEDRYCEYRLKDGEHDAAREAMRALIDDPVEPLNLDIDGEPDTHGLVVRYRGVYIGDIWPPDDWDDEPSWGNYPAPIIRVDDETPVTAGYGFDGEDGFEQARQWFIDRLAKIKRGDWRRGDGR